MTLPAPVVRVRHRGRSRGSTVGILASLLVAGACRPPAPADEQTSAAARHDSTSSTTLPDAGALRRALRGYVLAQEVYFAEYGRYADHVDSISVTPPDGASFTIISVSRAGHSAMVRSGTTPPLLCAVWVGERPPQLDHDRQAEPVCDIPARFEAWLAAPRTYAASQPTPTDQPPPVIYAPRTGAPAPPVRSGVLLGLQSWQRGYRTIWIAGDGDSIALLARGPGLLVPRPDGFWRVDSPRDCAYVAAGPAETWPAGATALGPSWLGPVPPECPDETGTIEIHYLGPDYLAVNSWGELVRAVDSWDDYFVAFLDSIDQGWRDVPVGRFLAPAVSSRLADMERAKIDSMRPRGDDEVCLGWSRAGWEVHRRGGLWALAAHYAPSFYACGRFSLRVPGIAPPGLVGHNELFPDWDAIHAALPGAGDAVSSPGRDLLIVLSRDSLHAFHVEGDRVGRRAFVTAEPGRIVMAEWAVGGHVQRWTHEVWKLLNPLSTGAAR